MNVTLNCNTLSKNSNPAFGRIIIADNLMRDIKKGKYFVGADTKKSMTALNRLIKRAQSNPEEVYAAYFTDNVIAATCKLPNSKMPAYTYYKSRTQDIISFLRAAEAYSRFIFSQTAGKLLNHAK